MTVEKKHQPLVVFVDHGKQELRVKKTMRLIRSLQNATRNFAISSIWVMIISKARKNLKRVIWEDQAIGDHREPVKIETMMRLLKIRRKEMMKLMKMKSERAVLESVRGKKESLADSLAWVLLLLERRRMKFLTLRTGMGLGLGRRD
jgi:hypothetical protein